MFFHRCLQHFGGQLQEIVANLAHQHDRPFDEARNLGQQARVFYNRQTAGKGGICRVVPDGCGALCGIQHHKGALELGAIVIKGTYGKSVRCHETMSTRCVSGDDTVQLYGYNLAACFIRQDAQDRVQRAHPFQAARAPSHGLGPWKVAYGVA